MVTIIVKLNCKTKKYNECLAYKVLKIVLTGLTQGARSMSANADVDFVLLLCTKSISLFLFFFSNNVTFPLQVIPLSFRSSSESNSMIIPL